MKNSVRFFGSNDFNMRISVGTHMHIAMLL